MSFFPTPTSEQSMHKGNCHCGAVSFRFSLSPPLSEYHVVSCNCSICSKNGYLLVYPSLKDFTLESGAETTRTHQFGRRQAKHEFCGTCGSSCFIRLVAEDAPPIIAVNVRLLEDCDLDKLNYKKVDGRSF
ncbi:hypothetical protein BO83DRAFT_437542 [Aspergillus eucalypticola CBS 122712]|uniref:CENP-V/GFA domain-containing protein n=1 Tax=Aspergillus eucalypticola (strain CBS 122712 / IBT 29274) TaxID=1448314 RepID=A0A317VHD8_ASPEC|nr:uncharacterized protein BO83DRAFT_437542 [Aspergillus eucalypticola CBS 122712]PWY72587.1 hypothetical protein BO83DRAFT_437542 [Aspergillus eucalypticola CBS 122712]